jgi:hypothetical protein
MGFGDVRILLLPFILGLCLHKQTVFFSLGPILNMSVFLWFLRDQGIQLSVRF